MERFLWEIANVIYLFPTVVLKSGGKLFKTNIYIETIVFIAVSVLLS